MVAAVYDAAVQAWAGGQLDWEGDDIRALLATGDYEPRQNKDRVRADLGKTEVKPAGSYEPGGLELQERRIDHDPLTGRVRLWAAPLRWGSFTGEFRYVILYASHGGAGADLLIGFADLGNQEATNASIRLEYPASVCEFIVEPAP